MFIDNKTQTKHLHLTIDVGRDQWQGFCSCGWQSLISYFEEVDLLRAMHAHAVATFRSYL